MALDLNAMAVNVKTLLASVPGIASAYEYEPQNLGALPAATLYFDGFEGQEATIGKIRYGWRWTIRIYIPINTSDVSAPQLTTRQLTKDVIAQLRSNLTLLGSCMYCTVYTGDIYNILSQTNPMMVIELNLVATTEESR